MLFKQMFVTAVCVLFLLKLKWPKSKSFLLLCFEYMAIIKLKTESQTVNRKPHRKVTKIQINILPFPGLAQSGTEQPGQGATLLGWPKSIC